jgi:hypothetical protein
MFSSVLTVSLPSLFWVTLPSNVKLDSCAECKSPFGLATASGGDQQ